MYISIPRRNCSALEKGQLQVRRDLWQAVALEHKCRGWPSVGHARQWLGVDFRPRVGGFNLGGAARLAGSSGGNCTVLPLQSSGLCDGLGAAESCSEMGRSCLAPHEGQCMHTRACLAYGYYLTCLTFPPTYYLTCPTLLSLLLFYQ